jgi:hypothetical protein
LLLDVQPSGLFPAAATNFISAIASMKSMICR